MTKKRSNFPAYLKNLFSNRLMQVLLVIFGFFTLVLSIVAFLFMYKSGINNANAILSIFSPNSISQGNAEGGASDEELDQTMFGEDVIGMATPEPWNGSDRVTLLLMGLDYRDWSDAEDGPSRSDTMILLTIDPLTKTAGVLSIPRDLWAVIPGFSPGKINTAYYLGELYNVPGGGPALAMETVEQTIGVPIDYYAQVDFSAFVKFVDLIEGVKLDIPEKIKVDPLGESPPRYLQPGRQTLTGELALAYARNRYTTNGDFDRAARQQQVILAIRDRIIDFNMLPTLVANASEIYAELSDGIDTNLSLSDAIKLASLAIQVSEDDIKTGIINQEYITYGASPDDLAILIPIPDKIRELRDEIFASSSIYSPVSNGTDVSLMQLEGANVALFNGTSSSSTLQQAEAYLTGQGMIIVSSGQASQSYSYTTMIDHTGNPYTLRYMTDTYGIFTQHIVHDFDPNSSVDVEIYIGSDWALP